MTTLFDRHTPAATYRLQFHAGFTFEDAQALVPYLERLGVGALYASPILQARAGSPHGYDIIDHATINREMGGAGAFDALARSVRRADMGLLMDFVPNHMGIGQADNTWWLDVLEWGRGSPYADFFDIDWRPVKAELRDKVLVPVLGDHYGAILEQGELVPRFDPEDGGFSVWYWENRLPLTPPTYGPFLEAALRAGDSLLKTAEKDTLRALADSVRGMRRRGLKTARGWRARRDKAIQMKDTLRTLAATSGTVRQVLDQAADSLRGQEGRPRSFQPLHRLLEDQHYRLSYWRVASHEINYRRFFQINDLAGLRMELPEVFDAAHVKVRDLFASGAVTGLRIDHIDGLFAPRRYLRRLQDTLRPLLPEVSTDSTDSTDTKDQSAEPTRDAWVVVEKILAAHESIREDWAVSGTTGYDFCAQVNGVLIDPSGERAFRRLYKRITGAEVSFDDITYASRKQVMDAELSAELYVLANELERLTEQDWRTRDFTLTLIRDALRELVACFPVYRTYVNALGATQEDLRDIDWAIARAKKSQAFVEPAIFDFLHSILTTAFARVPGRRRYLDEVVRIARKFQQYSSPVMAKGIEDTAFYRYNLLVSMNEVGCHPNHWGQTVGAFHYQNQDRARRRPFGMLTTATHDTKRGEDTRARVTALSEFGEEWNRRVRRWRTLNRRARAETNDGAVAPSANDEYLFYQSLIGVWPVDLPADERPTESLLAPLTERLIAYMMKAMREAKVHTAWTARNQAYEAAVEAFIRKVLDASAASSPFLRDVQAFHAQVAPAGALNSLAQTTLKLTVPGTPDIYQGCELWDDSLVDPDNRRPVDFALRDRLLAELERRADDPSLPGDLLTHWPDGRLKLHLTRALLGARRADPALFTEAAYLPLETEGRHADRLIAFARRADGPDGGRWLVVAVPRCASGLTADGRPFPLGEDWRKTRFTLPEDAPEGPWHDLPSGGSVTAENGLVLAADAFARLPVAVLTTGS